MVLQTLSPMGETQFNLILFADQNDGMTFGRWAEETYP